MRKKSAMSRQERMDLSLTTAIEYQKLTAVDELLEDGASANAVAAQLPCQWTALTLAVKVGNEKIVKKLLANGALVDKKGGNIGGTPLHYAVWEGHAEIAQLLVSCGASPNAKDSIGGTCLHCATANEDLRPEVVLDFVQMLLGLGADVNARDSQSGITALHNALTNARWDWTAVRTLVQLLVSHGADVNLKDFLGQTALHYAAARKKMKPPLINYLLEQGASRSLEWRGNVGMRPLHYAALKSNSGVVWALLSAGANMSARCDFKMTVVHCAAQNRNMRVMRLLLNQFRSRFGPKEMQKLVNARKEFNQETALHLAYEDKNFGAAVILEARGAADLNATTVDGRKPMEMLLTEDEVGLGREFIRLVPTTDDDANEDGGGWWHHFQRSREQ